LKGLRNLSHGFRPHQAIKFFARQSEVIFLDHDSLANNATFIESNYETGDIGLRQTEPMAFSFAQPDTIPDFACLRRRIASEPSGIRTVMPSDHPLGVDLLKMPVNETSDSTAAVLLHMN
jgi:hypothetical protein